MPSACARFATSVPIPPRPTTSRVFPCKRLHPPGRRHHVGPAGRHALRDEELETARKRQHHRQHVLGHHGARHPLIVREQDVALAYGGNRDTALDARPVRMDPADLRTLRENLRIAESDDRIGVSGIGNGVGRVSHGHDLDVRRRLPQHRRRYRASRTRRALCAARASPADRDSASATRRARSRWMTVCMSGQRLSVRARGRRQQSQG